ncbi:uncharacterized protein DUF4291 [Micromonospora pisi]|uniref:Uncharacterized protein DUF4291 n=1 Tax=Micromonospora pisi TaxID=589240 RepID=A0A495JBX4_9ACTN|nr:DUF4291 domain-containing protein [Micromonospora pisi]RKR86008.1 uncharacterized protein DUF4291 [Micromonospora pisi]
MAPLRQIRADFDAHTIVVYQAYSPTVARAAVTAGRFVAPFSFTRMTWIKPSFLWLMHRSNWARKANQEQILAVRITRQGWERALSRAVPTTPGSGDGGRGEDLADAAVHVQWDPERSLRGAALNHYSIQVGIGRELIREYAEQWVTGIDDLTPRVRRMAELLGQGRSAQAQRLLPPERVYPLSPPLAAAVQADR